MGKRLETGTSHTHKKDIQKANEYVKKILH